MIEIDKVKDRIYLWSSRPTPGLFKHVPGAAFSREGGAHWSIPLTMDACVALRNHFGNELKVRGALSDWYRAEDARSRTMAELGAAHDAELRRIPDVSPRLAAAMADRTYQRVGARFIAEAHQAEAGGVLIASQPGLGKTLMAIGGVIEAGIPGPYLVITPKTAVETVWAREIPRWWPGQQVITVPDGRAARDEILWDVVYGPHVYDGQNARDSERLVDEHRESQNGTWVVVHPEMVRTKSFWNCPDCGELTKWRAGPRRLDCEHAFDQNAVKRAGRINQHTFSQLFGIDWGAIISDESDRMLLRRTGTPTQVRQGAELLRTRPRGMQIAMSGTPFRGRPHLLWGTLNWLRPKQYSAFWRWAETYFEVTSGWGGSRDIGKLRAGKQKDLDRALSAVMLRQTKREVAKDLPDKNHIGTPLVDEDESSPVGVWLPLDGPQKKLYDQMRDGAVATMAGGELNAIGILAELTRLKQFATSAGHMISDVFHPGLPSNKFDYLLEKLEEMGFPDDPETKVVVVSQFTQILDLFAAELRAKHKIDSAMLTGKVTGKRRDEAITRFNDPEAGPHLMFLNVKAGGVAITIDTADHMFFLDETWIPDDQEQAEDRIHRVSNPRPVFYHYLRSIGTVEEGIAVVNADRASTSHDILDGRRGVEYARKIVQAL